MAKKVIIETIEYSLFRLHLLVPVISPTTTLILIHCKLFVLNIEIGNGKTLANACHLLEIKLPLPHFEGLLSYEGINIMCMHTNAHFII